MLYVYVTLVRSYEINCMVVAAILNTKTSNRAIQIDYQGHIMFTLDL